MSNIKFSQLPNLGNITATTIVPVVSANTNYTVTAANLQSYVNSSTGNVTGGNVLTGGVVSATGNVTGNFFIGNGSQLTGLPATYGNANVVANLAALGSNPVSTTGNVTGGNLLFGSGVITGTGNVTGGNILTGGLISATGTVTGTSHLGSVVSVTANVTGGNVLTGGLISATSTITGTSHLGSVVSVTANVTGGNILTAGVVTATGNIVTVGNFVGNGAALSNVTVSVAGNIVGTQSNVTLVAGAYSTVFDNTGNTAFANGTVSLTTLSASGNITGGNILATNHTGTTVSVTGNITAANFFGNGNTLSNVATRFESAWTVPVGNSTQSFTVTASETYYMWVDCNIPNGILAWNATATVTNTNVPVVGVQYAWVYNGGGTPIDFTSIPNQFVGTANTIVRSNVAPSSTTNRFDFGINNTSGASQTVRYGWIAIS
jgi:hypothetical protein